MITTETHVTADMPTVSETDVVLETQAEAPRVGPGWMGQVAENVADVWSNAATVADAQISIWSMKFVRIAVLAALGLPLMVSGVALFIYGFVLLDRSFAYALAWPNYPLWLSPLVRGGIYFGIPAIGLIILLITTVGSFSSPSSESPAKSSEDCHV